MPVAYILASPLLPSLIAIAVKISIQYGHTPASAVAYAYYGYVACNRLKDIETGVRFGQIALKLVSKLNATIAKPEVNDLVALYLLHRKYHLQETLPLLQEGYTLSLEVGNLDFAGYNANLYCLNGFWAGLSLNQLKQEVQDYCTLLIQLNQVTIAGWCKVYWQSILNLLGYSDDPTFLSGDVFQELNFLKQQEEVGDVHALHLFFLYKSMLSYTFGDVEASRQHIIKSRQYLQAAVGMILEPSFYFYDSLIKLTGDGVKTEEELKLIGDNQSELQEYWAKYSPMNHQHKVDLVEAEKHRVLGQRLEALELYEKAISGAKENDYIQEEALANELFAKFYLDWGKEKYSALHMQAAYYCYAQWGAKAKTDDLEQRYPQLLKPILQRELPNFSSKVSISKLTSQSQCKTATVANISSILDFSSLLKAYQILSVEIELDRLLSTLMKIILENAGATKGALLLSGENGLTVEAIATRTNDDLQLDSLHQSIPLKDSQNLPAGLINYVRRTTETALLDAKNAQEKFAADNYLLRCSPQSLLCMPLLERGNLIGILYLENILTADAFTRDRVELLDALCAQAAISLSNAQLYQKAQQALEDLQAAQLQLVQHEKMAALGNLVAGVAHEINNPVGFIGGNVTVAQEHLQDLLDILALYQQKYPNPDAELAEELEERDIEFIGEDFPKLIESMEEGCERIRNISNSLRTFSRTDKEHQTSFNIHEGIDSTLLILKYRLKANENRPAIEIVKEYGELPEVTCFPGQLNQVFMNLLANAIDALDESNEGKTFNEIARSPNCMTIKTFLSEDKQKVIIQITDNGTGIPEDVKAKIFEQGFTTKGVGKGTGLGMAIAHQIIAEKHGGAIACHSERGLGTEFIISLPIA